MLDVPTWQRLMLTRCFKQFGYFHKTISLLLEACDDSWNCLQRGLPVWIHGVQENDRAGRHSPQGFFNNAVSIGRDLWVGVRLDIPSDGLAIRFR